MLINYQDFLYYNSFQVKIQVNNLRTMLDRGLLDDYLAINFTYYNRNYSIFEIITRGTFLIITLTWLIIFYFLIIKKTTLKKIRNEQISVLSLLVLQVLYNNPLYFFEFLVRSSVFYIVNALFISTYLAYLLLNFLIITHSIMLTKKERTSIWFYLPKILIVGSLWLATIGSFSILKGEELYNSSFRSDNNYQYQKQIIIIIQIVLLSLYIFNVLYYLVRIISKIRNLPTRNTLKFISVWGFTLVVIIAVLVNYLIITFKQQWNNAVETLIIFSILNFYGIFLSILYIPYGNLEIDEKVEQEEDLLLNQGDEKFEKYD